MDRTTPLVLSIYLFLIFLIRTSNSKIQNQLQRGSSLSVEDSSDLLSSPDNSFTCGFYSVGTSNAFWFAIWFTDSTDRTVVWTANRDMPVNGKGSRFTLRGNGAMVLTDVDGTVVWQSETTSTQVNMAELLNTGNLVLKNQSGGIVWQSFDHPTDTLLPNQTFTKSKRLVSAYRNGSFASGYFNMVYDSENVLILIYDGPEISSKYWPNPNDANVWASGRTNYNSSRIAVLDDMGTFLSSDRWEFSASDVGLSDKRRLTMDYDGNLRIYSLNNKDGSWSVTWQAMQQPCNVHGICGRNGICVYQPKPACSCPPGYEIRDPEDMNQGCKPMFDKSCSNSTKFKFLEIPNTDYYGYDLSPPTPPVTFEECRDLCLHDCLCEAFDYRTSQGAGMCFPKSALFNGFQSPNFAGSIYFKVPIGFKTSESSKNHTPVHSIECQSNKPTTVPVGSSDMYQSSGKMVKWAYLYGFAIAIGAVEAFIFILGWWFFIRNQGLSPSVEQGYRMISSQFRGFSYAELKKATKNFKLELGKGGSGSVYKGILTDERVVAVKRLGDLMNQGEEEFWAEVSTIGKINHMNLVRMWGFCSEKKHKLLVYEFVENLSLDRRLFTSDFLQWRQRFKVALGTAKGLAYLHHECLEWVIHCDVKPENILLDGTLEPKIADFGLAKLAQRGGPSSEFTRIRGTKGYMAPEWALNLPITAKVDVYSYGVVILEMVKGIRLSNWVVEDGEEEESQLSRFVRVVTRKIRCGEESWMEETVDPRLKGQFSRKQVATLVEIGLSCVEEDRNKRPTMDSVVQVLQDCESD